MPNLESSDLQMFCAEGSTALQHIQGLSCPLERGHLLLKDSSVDYQMITTVLTAVPRSLEKREKEWTDDV